VVMHACNPSTLETEAGGSQVPGKPGLHSETLSLNKYIKLMSIQILQALPPPATSDLLTPLQANR
jgi:short-subunit dehydrogenase involved in D-alanine esterification of teichoic acids